MTGFLWAALGVLGGLGMTAIGDMLSEEVRDKLDHVPHAILRLAARRLDPKQHAALYEKAWLPDLAYFLRGDEARPVTRLFHGTRFALASWSALGGSPVILTGRLLLRPGMKQPFSSSAPETCSFVYLS